MWPIEYNLNQINTVASQVLQVIKEANAKCITLNGNLGAGKTTLVKAIGKQLQINTNITSPTYSLVNEYEGQNFTIHHLDLYRLKDEQEAIDAGIEEVIYNSELCFIEWPLIIEAILPLQSLHFYITIIDTEKRSITFSTALNKMVLKSSIVYP
jgi:tRNA threonylcarbamoyladenosine biosynthesis protein TsaE